MQRDGFGSGVPVSHPVCRIHCAAGRPLSELRYASLECKPVGNCRGPQAAARVDEVRLAKSRFLTSHLRSLSHTLPLSLSPHTHTAASTSTRNFPTNSRSRAKTRLSDSTTFELRQEVRSCATGKPVRVARHTPDATKVESRPYDSLGGRRGLACLRTIATLPWRSLTHLSARRSALRFSFSSRVITRLHRRSV